MNTSNKYRIIVYTEIVGARFGIEIQPTVVTFDDERAAIMEINAINSQSIPNVKQTASPLWYSQPDGETE